MPVKKIRIPGRICSNHANLQNRTATGQKFHIHPANEGIYQAIPAINDKTNFTVLIPHEPVRIVAFYPETTTTSLYSIPESGSNIEWKVFRLGDNIKRVIAKISNHELSISG